MDCLVLNGGGGGGVDRVVLVYKGEGLQVVGRDLDDLVQAIESTQSKPVIGVQWHPEYLFYIPAQYAIFRWLLQTAE